MATAASSSHRQTASLRQNLAHSSLEGRVQSPHTPVRQTAFQTPSSHSPAARNEDDCLIFEIGTRYMRAGYANDSAPRCVIGFGPEEQRRAGDYSQWEPGYQSRWRERKGDLPWGEAHELWRMDLRNVDLGLIEDKIERAVREAYTRYLLTDSKSRRLLLALPSGLPHALLSSLLTTLFSSLQCPSISIMSTPVLATIAAGLRSALVIDIGWSETTITGVVEYREVTCLRSVRATKTVVSETGRFLARKLKSTAAEQTEEERDDHTDAVSFEETEDVVYRTGWCRSRNETSRSTLRRATSNDTLQQVQEPSLDQATTDTADPLVDIRLESTLPPTTLRIPFHELAEPTEAALFRHGTSREDRPDDHEMPIGVLAFNSLRHLPVDVRSICMGRIVVIGGGSNIPGVKRRIVQEIVGTVADRGWDPVQGQAADQRKERLRAMAEKKSANARSVKQTASEESDNAASATEEPDPIAEKISREHANDAKPHVRGTVRACHSLGAFAGASLVATLKLRAICEVERESFLTHGLGGASKDVEVSAVPTASRLSMAGAGLARAAGGGAGDRTSWTMGAWT